MAGDWLKLEHALPDKPEVWEIAEALDLDPDAVVGKLVRVWIWFDQQSRTGHAPSVTKKLLDRDVGCAGFTKAMIGAGWLVDDGKSVSVPNFDRHMGKTAKDRALTTQRQRRKRDSSVTDVTQGVTETSRSQRDGSVTREEKRREVTTTPPPPARAREDHEPRDPRLTPVPQDFDAGESLRLWARHLKLTDQQIDAAKDEFVRYWTARGEERVNWRSVFMERLKDVAKGKAIDEGNSDAAQQKRGRSDRADVINAIYDPLAGSGDA